MDAVFKLAAVYSIVDKLSAPVKAMAGTVTKFENQLNKAKGVSNFGMKMGAMGAVLNESGNTMKNMMQGFIEPFAKVEDASAALKTVVTSTMGGAEKSIKATQKAAIEWSKIHTDSAEKFMQTSYMMASAGLNDVQSIEATKTAMTVAKATMGDSGEAASLIATLYNNMGDKTRDAGTEMQRLGDIVTKTQQTFQFKNLGQLTEGLKYAVPTALQFSMSIEEVNTVIGQLNNAGITGGQAGTAFAATMRQMNKASAELGFSIARTADGGVSMIGTIENIRAKYGSFAQMTTDQQEAFKKAFGDEGLRAISLLMDKTGDMNKNLKAVTNSTNAARDAQKTMEDTVHGRAIIAAQRLEALKIAFGEKLLGNKQMIDTIIPRFTSLVEKIGNMVLAFTEAHPVLSSNLMMLFALSTGLLLLIAPILSVGSKFFIMAGQGLRGIIKLVKGIKWLQAALRSESMRTGIAALKTKLVDAFDAGRGAVRRCIGSLKSFMTSCGKASKAAGTAAVQGLKKMALGMAGVAKQALRAAVTAIPAMCGAVWSLTAALLANPITWIVLALVALGAIIYYLIQKWNTFSDTTKMLIAIFFPLGAAIAWLANNWDMVKQAAENAWNGTVEAVKSAFVWIQDCINGGIAWMNGMIETFFTSGAALWGAFTDGIRSALYSPVEAVQEGLQWIRNMLPFSDAKEGPLSQLTHNGKKLMSTIADGVHMEAPKLYDAVGQGLNIEGIMQNPAWRGISGEGGQKTIFSGNTITIQVEKMDSPDDFAAAMKQFASEIG